MPNSRDLKALLKPLLGRRRELAFVRRVLFFTPLTHYLRGVVFVQRGASSGDADAIPFGTPLFMGSYLVPEFFIGTGQYEYAIWDWRNRDFDQLSVDLCDKLEHEALPLVEAITDPQTHEKSGVYFEPPRWDGLHGQTARFKLALGACYYGDYDRARTLTDQFDEEDRSDLQHAPLTEEFKYHMRRWKRALYLAKVLRENEAGIPQLLHDWERYSVETMNLTKYWKSTPFPCDKKRAG